ncbi:uncharacterized protein MONOS_4456 [Monocercomonoides exilis]|uniref:uncharacterized protein n=1 Tax=Monocercomonoides exilis TaxID=2049356 RepID=UPI00355A7A85|nr:hypothetical protein MONOS_4456 [Monocercomonoides exilis]|eukprot:MONOS_4456.1-p1 / transcript=MONOS_4456.1 / gene=MONOS_4456 / organism=Monocercomonoides_exilis_PA203 / gene_product=unspecified product / transcript_product=unspecified product / location=Mono_scaffold00118:101513-103759(-) / protein_length=749 / sequence_SO=supercontig / SO=protein_coding / is_pseudo=false
MQQMHDSSVSSCDNISKALTFSPMNHSKQCNDSRNCNISEEIPSIKQLKTSKEPQTTSLEQPSQQSHEEVIPAITEKVVKTKVIITPSGIPITLSSDHRVSLLPEPVDAPQLPTLFTSPFFPFPKAKGRRKRSAHINESGNQKKESQIPSFDTKLKKHFKRKNQKENKDFWKLNITQNRNDTICEAKMKHFQQSVDCSQTAKVSNPLQANHLNHSHFYAPPCQHLQTVPGCANASNDYLFSSPSTPINISSSQMPKFFQPAAPQNKHKELTIQQPPLSVPSHVGFKALPSFPLPSLPQGQPSKPPLVEKDTVKFAEITIPSLTKGDAPSMSPNDCFKLSSSDSNTSFDKHRSDFMFNPSLDQYSISSFPSISPSAPFSERSDDTSTLQENFIRQISTSRCSTESAVNDEPLRQSNPAICSNAAHSTSISSTFAPLGKSTPSMLSSQQSSSPGNLASAKEMPLPLSADFSCSSPPFFQITSPLSLTFDPITPLESNKQSYSILSEQHHQQTNIETHEVNPSNFTLYSSSSPPLYQSSTCYTPSHHLTSPSFHDASQLSITSPPLLSVSASKSFPAMYSQEKQQISNSESETTKYKSSESPLLFFEPLDGTSSFSPTISSSALPYAYESRSCYAPSSSSSSDWDATFHAEPSVQTVSSGNFQLDSSNHSIPPHYSKDLCLQHTQTQQHLKIQQNYDISNTSSSSASPLQLLIQTPPLPPLPSLPLSHPPHIPLSQCEDTTMSITQTKILL